MPFNDFHGANVYFVQGAAVILKIYPNIGDVSWRNYAKAPEMTSNV